MKPGHIKIHPGYNEKTRENNIAIISVAKVQPFNFVKESVKPGPILQSTPINKASETITCEIAGWGQTIPRKTFKDTIRDLEVKTEKRWQGSTYLKEAKISIWSEIRCEEAYNDNLANFINEDCKLSDTNICAGAPGGDLCTVSTNNILDKFLNFRFT